MKHRKQLSHFPPTNHGLPLTARLVTWSLASLLAHGALAQTPPPAPMPQSSTAAVISPATAETAATTAPAAAVPADSPESCRILTDRAMDADLKAATAQSQKSDAVVLGKLLDKSIGR